MDVERVLRLRSNQPSDLEERLGAALEQALAQGVSQLDVLCAFVNGQGLRDPDGSEWTAQRLVQFLRQLP
ncbi:hypothetical protein JI739_10000 [Ramlibacter sp. AW1]|uniref:Recombinase-like domain-containing protein n=1 Tax=Ramlibacter aurantiacus TaxID=2801330 RepID=A0A936ZT54_9BURK|nr:recombinase-like helix-turn-helix domain-containing protein [Ramlibacter aurantiacus]MBL0420675.1 hypothetical protein [Ramlibacter aurantiacus]